MRARQVPSQSLVRLAEAQSGVLSRRQALLGGMSSKAVYRLLADGTWGSLERGILLVPDVAPSWLTRVWAGLLLGGERARASGSTAAALLGLDDEQRLPIEILVPSGSTPPQRDWLRFRQERDQVRAPSSASMPPRTRIADTVLDMCAECADTARIHWITTAVQRRLVSAEGLLIALHRRPRMRNRQFLVALLTDVSAGVHSNLEYRYLHDVEMAHGLPTGSRQRVRPRGGGYIDVAYERFALLVELDGRIGHIGDGHFRDRRRDNSHTRVGLRTLRFGWREVADEPCAVALEVAEVLVGLGWAGYPGRCPRCR